MIVKLDSSEIQAKVADNYWKRGLGLSLRKKGKMLFKFPSETKAPIDMMFMRRKLFLYFMNSDKEVIHIERAKPWYRLPSKLFHSPPEKYRYLLESFEDLNIEEGDRLYF